jgi:GAF domain-containing protein
MPRHQRYSEIYPQLVGLIGEESNWVASMANLSAALKEVFGFWWIGFYVVEDDQLVLGPFQGPVACTRLFKGRGVCAKAWETGQTVIVPNVDEFPGHVACSGATRSEIVVPIKDENGQVWAVLDIDSDQLDDFDEEDQRNLEKIATLLQKPLQ